MEASSLMSSATWQLRITEARSHTV
uniref:Uncharacterized protein n=1 Tax=Zea mays TaxID=4577 RepID=B4FM97_MAIZE|nr:unknown [Zea mays]